MKTKRRLTVEVNSKHIDMETGLGTTSFFDGKVGVMVTPPIGEDYWQFRVHLEHDQYIVAFPKFMQIGVGFAKEEEKYWNTNLPATCSPEKIFDWIKNNKFYASIPDELCIAAIKLICKTANEYTKAQRQAEEMTMVLNEPLWKSEKTGYGLTIAEFKKLCHVLHSRRVEIFSNGFGDTAKKKKYCMVFGSNGMDGWKYKYTFYEICPAAAYQAFYRTMYNHLKSGYWPKGTWEKFEVSPEFAFETPRTWKCKKSFDLFWQDL